jgi:hypothetical protein
VEKHAESRKYFPLSLHVRKPAVAKLARNRYTVLVGSPESLATSAGINPLEA